MAFPLCPVLIHARVQVIILLHHGADFFFRLPLAGQDNGDRCGLRTLHSLGMAVRDTGHRCGELFRLFHVAGDKTDRADPHGRTVAVAVVRLRVVREHPVNEACSVAAVRELTSDALHRCHRFLRQIREVRIAVHEGLRHRAGHDRVVGELAVRMKEIKLLTQIIAEFKTGTHNISNDRSKHILLLSALFLRCSRSITVLIIIPVRFSAVNHHLTGRKKQKRYLFHIIKQYK